MENRISIIVPIYNAEQYLAKCIESLLHQSHFALQIILVNDGSTDKSLSIAQTYATKDERIEVYSLDSNQGQSAARNEGLLHATGEFVSFVDADDYIDSDFYTYITFYTKPFVIFMKLLCDCRSLHIGRTFVHNYQAIHHR